MCVKHDLTKETALSVTVCVKRDSSGRRSQLSMTTGADHAHDHAQGEGL